MMKFPCLLLLIGLMVTFPGCKKKVDNIAGNWQGTLTLELAHQHEEFQDWTEEIVHEDGRVEEVIHEEHIAWQFWGKVNIEFAFNLDSPLYEAQIEGEGNATQEGRLTPPVQCPATSLQSPNFRVTVYGDVDSTTFNLKIVPVKIPVLTPGAACEHVQVTFPAYGTPMLEILDRINLTVPAQDNISTGGSGTIPTGGGFTAVSYIYTFTLRKIN